MFLRYILMKRIASLIAAAAVACSFTGCSTAPEAQVAATTLPVYEFTSRICQGTDISVARLVTESVSCLHDYALNVRQVRAVEAAEVVVISGAGMEEFMEDMLEGRNTIDASEGIELIEPEEHHHGHEEEGSHEGHSHEEDPHIWLSPVNAAAMAENICDGLSARYPEYAADFEENLTELQAELEALHAYGEENLRDLSCREIITFHDGFNYLADCYGLEILRAVEEESGSEASAAELIELIEEVEHHDLPAIFTETNGSVSAAGIIARETGAGSYALDMAMGGDSYFDAMYHNIDTLKEALE